MAQRIRAVQLLANELLPESERDYKRALDAKQVEHIAAYLAEEKQPSEFRTGVQDLGNAGRRAAWFSGLSIGLKDLEPLPQRHSVLKALDAELDGVRKTSTSREDFNSRRDTLYRRYADLMQKMTMRDGEASGNALVASVRSGARGKPAQVQAMLATPAVYQDASGKLVPLFVRNSFSSGLRPAEYAASSYGTRASIVQIKRATALGGDWGKLLAQSGADTTVQHEDCGASTGLAFDRDSGDLRGRVLATAAGSLPAGTVLDKKALSVLRRQKVDKVVARSPMTCSLPEGVCKRCYGLSYNGKFPNIGEHVGMTSAHAASEPVAQGSLNCLVDGTLVRMADMSVKKIEDIRVGELVLGSDAQGMLLPVAVTAVWDQGLQPTSEFKFRLGATKSMVSVGATDAHIMLATKMNYGAVKSLDNHKPSKLPIGYKHQQFSAYMAQGTAVDTGHMDDKLAVVVGLFFGDGIRSSIKTGAVKVSCADPSLMVELDRVLRPFDVTMKKAKRSHDWRFVWAGVVEARRGAKGTFIPMDTVQHPVKRALDRYGVLQCYAPEKVFPEFVKVLRKESLAALLAGYYSADGTFALLGGGNQTINVGSTSRRLLEQTKELLRDRFGIHGSSITRCGRAGTGSRKNDMWALAVSKASEVVKFVDAIGPYLIGVKRQEAQAVRQRAMSNQRANLPYLALRVSKTDTGIKHCRDISVGHPDELFVLANGLVVKNSKHTAGQAGSKKDFSGFDVISRFTQAPDEFPDRAAVATLDGVVESIEDAPQGGTIITVAGEQHYVQPGFAATVKRGDNVEAGDILSDGLANPSEIVDHKGIGEGRRYYVDRLSRILEDSGMKPDKRNIEVVARGALRSVVAETADEDQDWLPDDALDYEKVKTQWRPKDEHPVKPADAEGYLTRPALHFSTGTRLTTGVRKALGEVGLKEVNVSAEPPPFKSSMTRLRTAAHGRGDWLASMNTSYLTKQLHDSAYRGADTNTKTNTNYAPRLAVGVGFGENIKQTGKF